MVKENASELWKITQEAGDYLQDKISTNPEPRSLKAFSQ